MTQAILTFGALGLIGVAIGVSIMVAGVIREILHDRDRGCVGWFAISMVVATECVVIAGLLIFVQMVWK